MNSHRRTTLTEQALSSPGLQLFAHASKDRFSGADSDFGGVWSGSPTLRLSIRARYGVCFDGEREHTVYTYTADKAGGAPVFLFALGIMRSRVQK